MSKLEIVFPDAYHQAIEEGIITLAHQDQLPSLFYAMITHYPWNPDRVDYYVTINKVTVLSGHATYESGFPALFHTLIRQLHIWGYSFDQIRTMPDGTCYGSTGLTTVAQIRD